MIYGRLTVAEALENLDDARDDLKEAQWRWRLSYQPLLFSPAPMFAAVLCGNIDWTDMMGVFIVLSFMMVIFGAAGMVCAWGRDGTRETLLDARKSLRQANKVYLQAMDREN